MLLRKLGCWALLAVFAASNAYSDCLEPTAEVSEVYPRAEKLPENLLRLYVYFSEPMSRDDTSLSVSLLDHQGDPIPGVFLDNRYDLWSPDGTRLTVLFDPGRVKTGLAAHNRLGRALISEVSYTLAIDEGLDEKGCPLKHSFTKPFQAQDAYSNELDLSQWSLNKLAAGTLEPLSVNFNREMDHLSLAYRIRVEDTDGNRIRGALSLVDNEQIWRFTPTSPWKKQGYRIAIDTALEDVAGNRLTGLFDRPPTEEHPTTSPEKQYLLFNPI